MGGWEEGGPRLADVEMKEHPLLIIARRHVEIQGCSHSSPFCTTSTITPDFPIRALPASITSLKDAMRTAGGAAAAAAARLASASSLLYEDLLKRREELDARADQGGLQEERCAHV